MCRCGGTIISNLHVLTAASCTNGTTETDIRVVIGGHNLDERNWTTIEVSKVTADPNYSGGRPYNYDLAILTLEEPVNFSRTVSPACLPSDVTEDFTGQVATITGWGAINESYD